jgi:hypothetical protein
VPPLQGRGKAGNRELTASLPRDFLPVLSPGKLERGRSPRARWAARLLALVAFGASTTALAQDDSDETAAEPGDVPVRRVRVDTEIPAPLPPPGDLETYYPPAVAGPSLRVPLSPTRLYVDGGYGISNDLSALPYIAGRARNVRFAAGGVYRVGDFSFEAEIPFVNITRIDVTDVLNMAPLPEDAHQTGVSFGDSGVGVIWSRPLVGRDTLVAGFGLRTRLPTHSTRFEFHLADGSLAHFTIPYYFHIEPTLMLAGALGRFVFVVNQGAIAFAGPDGNFAEMHITVPTVLFWDAHYAVAYSPWTFLGASVELATQLQLNHVGDQNDRLDMMDVSKFNRIRAAWIAPALQVHLGTTRIDIMARIGLTRGQEVYGVLEYVGTSSLTLRLTHTFN